MEIQDQIRLVFRIKSGKYISAGNLVRVLTLTQQALFEVELKQMRKWKSLMADRIPDLVVDAVTHRMHEKSDSIFLITDLQRGSILIEGIAVALFVWTLEKTIGETVKIAWLDTSWHRFLLKILKRSVNRRKAVEDAVRLKLENHGIRASIENTKESVLFDLEVDEDSEIELSE